MLAVTSPAPTRIVRGELDGSRWELAQRDPAPHLRAHVRGYCGYVEHTGGPSRRIELPSAQAVAILELGPPLAIEGQRSPGGFVAGLDEGPTRTEHDGHQAGVQIDLTPIGARLLFGVPMSHLAGRVVAMRELLPAEHRHLAERVASQRGWAARLDVLEDVISRALDRARLDTRVVAWAYRRIEASGGQLDLTALCRELGYSRKHVITLFRDQIGVTPKQLARLMRFQRLVERVRARPTAAWADLAVACGYYDQAHLVREVRRFTGTTPTEARPLFAGLAALTGG